MFSFCKVSDHARVIMIPIFRFGQDLVHALVFQCPLASVPEKWLHQSAEVEAWAAMVIAEKLCYDGDLERNAEQRLLRAGAAACE